MMNPHFVTGYRTNLVFYIIECLVVIVMSIAYNRLSMGTLIFFVAYAVITAAIFFRGKKKHKLSESSHERLQSVAFVVVNIFLSISFDSAQVFVYAMSFGSVLTFVFLDEKLSRFQMILSMILIVVVAGFVSVYTGSQQTMYAFSFGTVVLFVMNWVIVSMTNIITFQNRKSIEQERSLDDLLKVVEAKCDEAQEATRSKTTFLANMSHEIRTPINAIMGMNEMILRESNESDIRNYASETRIATESLLGIINDILDITKIEAGKLTIIPVEYKTATLINDIYNLFRFRADAKELEFNVIADENLPRVLNGDDIRLKQILSNLLSNAVKYTYEGSVSLEIKLVQEDMISFSVKDTGIGIKEEDIGRLFNAFSRIEENRNRSIEGTGLGLNITTSLLEMFGSELKVKSVYGEGSEFSFILKQKVIDPTPIGVLDLDREYDYKPYNADFIAPDARVLVVDDNEMNRKVFINLLKDTKIRISEASSGKQCLKMIEETAYDIIFMDHMMPEMDGVQTLEAMRVQEKNMCKDTPVIILTANAVVGAKEYYMSVGFDGFLAKPVDPKKLEKMVFSALDKDIVIRRSGNKEEKTEAVSVELPAIDGIDWDYARLHFKDDKPLLDTVNLFYSAIKKDAQELDYYFGNIDNEESCNSYRVKVHSMKSSAAMIGIIQLSGMAMELEKAARSRKCEDIKMLHPIFIERWLSYQELLSELAETRCPVKNADDYKEEVSEIFAQIRSAAEEMDVDALDEMSGRLGEYKFNGIYAEKVEEIRSYILNFDIEKLMEYEY